MKDLIFIIVGTHIYSPFLSEQFLQSKLKKFSSEDFGGGFVNSNEQNFLRKRFFFKTFNNHLIILL